MEHIDDLDGPFRHGPLVNSALGCCPQTSGEVAAGNILHDEVKAALGLVVKVIVDGRDRRVVERREDHRLAFEILDRLCLLLFLDVRLDHLLDRTLSAAEVLIDREINGAHAAAADLFDDLVAAVEERSLAEGLEARAFTVGTAFEIGARE